MAHVEKHFIDSLFEDLDADIFNIPPSQPSPQRKAQPPSTAQQHLFPMGFRHDIKTPLSRKRPIPIVPTLGYLLNDMSLQAVSQRSKQRHVQRSYLRCQVVGLSHRHYKLFGSSTSRPRTEKVLILRVEHKKTTSSRTFSSQPKPTQESSQDDTRMALLRDEWVITEVNPGDYVNLIGDFEDDLHEMPSPSEWEATLEEKKEKLAKPLIEIAVEPQGQSANLARDELEEDDHLWAELGSLPSLSQAASQLQKPKLQVKTIILSSQKLSAQPIELEEEGQTTSHQDNLLILHPDVLVTATKVSDIASCMRKPIIQERLKGVSDTSVALIMGSMLHEVLQACLTGNGIKPEPNENLLRSDSQDASVWPLHWSGIGNFSHCFLLAQIDSQILLNIDSLFAIGLDTSDAKAKLEKAAAPFARFAKVFLGSQETDQFHDEAILVDERSKEPIKTKMTRILNVEEEIWSPMYGLKGKVDVSVEAMLLETAEGRPRGPPLNKNMPPRRSASDTTLPFRTRSSAGPTPSESHKVSVSVMPLEIKTGRAQSVALEHRAQTMLYTLMMSDRYGCNVTDGLLYYSQSGELHRIHRSRNQVRGLIMGRNELARFMMRKKDDDEGVQVAPLPATIDDERKCGRCYAVDGCMLFRRAVEGVVDPEADDDTKSTPIASLYQAKTWHLTEQHVDFFRKWDELLSLEEQDLVRFRRELWTMTANGREEAGRCFSDMRLLTDLDISSTRLLGSKDMHKFTHRFTRADSSAGASLLSGHISVSDPVTISIEPGLLSVAQGFVTALTTTMVEIGLDNDLQAALERSAEEKGIVTLDDDTIASTVFRIDKDELSSGMGRIRSNLASLFWAGEAGDVRRRELVVELVEPRFTEPQDVKLPSNLNEDQQLAIRKVLSAQDYALILGMPGTGKTTTIAKLIKLLTSKGKSVLLTSYTHSAVDTILRKLVNVQGVNILRLGNADKVHRDAQHLRLGKASSVSHLEEMLMTPNVVATTCLFINHVIFTKRKFDYCIVDEASQITLPTCLGPLRFADKFVLVGDHFQLPPLVRNARARKGGLDVSLFKLLSDKFEKTAMVHLSRQYRMNEDIMTLSNHLIYDGRLKCGNDEVAKQRLELANDQLLHGSKIPVWIKRALAPETSVLFLDTDSMVPETRVGNLIQNKGEAHILTTLTRSFIQSGISPSEIALITPYRQQIKLLTSTLDDPSVEIITADRSQGRDKSIILISLVRSNGFGTVGELLNDWRRINVAFTRAKKKLIVVGNARTLRRSEVLRDFFDLMQEREWVCSVQGGQLEMQIEEPVEKEESMEKKGEPVAMQVEEPSPARMVKEESPKQVGRVKTTSPAASRTKQATLTNWFSQPSSSTKRSIGAENEQVLKRPRNGKVTQRRSLLNSRPVLRDLINEAKPARD